MDLPHNNCNCNVGEENVPGNKGHMALLPHNKKTMVSLVPVCQVNDYSNTLSSAVFQVVRNGVFARRLTRQSTKEWVKKVLEGMHFFVHFVVMILYN